MMKPMMLCALLSGCAADLVWEPGTTMQISDGPAEWSVAVDDSVRLWERVLGEDCPFPYTLSPFMGELELRYVPAVAWDHEGEVGRQDADGITVLGDRAWSGVTRTLAHEFGHAFGLEHETERVSVMRSPSVSAPTAEDGLAARLALGCD